MMSPDEPDGRDWGYADPDPPPSTVDGLPAWVADALDAGSTHDWYDVDDDREQRNAIWSIFVRDVEATLEGEEQRRVLRTGRLALRGHLDAGEP